MKPQQQENSTSSDSVTEAPTTGKSSSAPTTSPSDQKGEDSSGGTPRAGQQNDSQQEPTTERERDQETEQEPKNKEAAKYRVRLREAEAERDALATRLDSLAEHVIAGQLTRHGINTDALRAAGHQPTEFFNEDGQFQPTSVDEAATAAAKRFGITRPIGAGYVPGSGTGAERSPHDGPGWEGLLKNPK